MRKGVTLIEILIVVSILGMISFSVFATYQSTQERLAFHEETTKIQVLINSVRSRALSETLEEDESSNFDYVIEFSPSLVRGYVNQDEEIEYGGSDDLIDEIEIGEIISIGQFNVLQKSGTETNWSGASGAVSLYMIFEPPYAECGFEFDTGANSSDLMVQIPIQRVGTDDDVLRYIYFHKESCIPEFLPIDLSE